MVFDPNQDIPAMLADFGVLVVFGAYSAKGIFDQTTKAESFGSEQADVLVLGPSVVVKADAFPGLKVGSALTVNGAAYAVRDRLAASDGKTIRIFLRNAP